MSSTSDERLAAAHGVTAPPRVVEVADGVFAYVQPDGSWWINNTGFVAGHEARAQHRHLRHRGTHRAPTSTPSSASRDPRRGSLVNTHHHGDHTNGNCLLPFATIVGHERCRQSIMETGILRPDGIWDPVEWGELAAAPPFVTFEERLNVYVDDLLVELHHFGTAAHTTNDVVAWIPERRVLFSGDLVFNGGTPFVLMGSVAGLPRGRSTRLAEFDAEVLVPGHGEPCAHGRDRRRGGVPALRAGDGRRGDGRRASARSRRRGARTSARSRALTDPERLVGNLHRAYAECDGAEPGDPIDLVAALVDMVAYNGGAPLRCSA